MKPDEFVSKWAAESETMRRRDALVDGAGLLEEMLADFESVVADEAETLLTLQEAARESGYTAEYLGRKVREGKIPNAGRLNAPRIRRKDLPRKPAGLRPDGPPLSLVSTSRGQIARSVVESERGDPR